MRAITVLKEEHTLILDFLDQMNVVVKKLTDNKPVPPEVLEQAVGFARELAHEFHHYKEEDIMFRLLAQKHAGALDAELDALKAQHEQCRNYIVDVAAVIDEYAAGKETSARLIHRNLTEYVKTLRDHINHENVVFFPKVSQELSETELNVLADEFDKWNQKTGGKVIDENRQRLEEIKGGLKA